MEYRIYRPIFNFGRPRKWNPLDNNSLNASPKSSFTSKQLQEGWPSEIIYVPKNISKNIWCVSVSRNLENWPPEKNGPKMYSDTNSPLFGYLPKRAPKNHSAPRRVYLQGNVFRKLFYSQKSQPPKKLVPKSFRLPKELTSKKRVPKSFILHIQP